LEVLRNRCLDPPEVVLNEPHHFLGHHARVFHGEMLSAGAAIL
jgi:hypothetical protein